MKIKTGPIMKNSRLSLELDKIVIDRTQAIRLVNTEFSVVDNNRDGKDRRIAKLTVQVRYTTKR